MDKQLYEILKLLGHEKEYLENEKIICRNLDIHHIFLLIKGNCFVDYNDENGNEIITNEFLDSVIFGAIEVIAGERDYIANVTALKKSRFIVVHKHDFLNELSKNCVFSSLMLKYIAQLSIEVMDQLRLFKLKNDYTRLIVFLLKRAKEVPVIIDDKKEFISNLLSINERTLYRYVKRLESEHALTRKGQAIFINEENKENLKKLL